MSKDITPHEREITWDFDLAELLWRKAQEHWAVLEPALQELQAEHDATQNRKAAQKAVAVLREPGDE